MLLTQYLQVLQRSKNYSLEVSKNKKAMTVN